MDLGTLIDHDVFLISEVHMGHHFPERLPGLWPLPLVHAAETESLVGGNSAARRQSS